MSAKLDLRIMVSKSSQNSTTKWLQDDYFTPLGWALWIRDDECCSHQVLVSAKMAAVADKFI